MAATVPNTPVEQGWFSRFVHHRHVHMGANAFSSIQGIALGLWIAEVFWGTRSAPSGYTLAWILTIYMLLEPMTATLTVVRKDRWLSVLADFGVALILVVEIGFVWYDSARLMVFGDRASAAAVLFLVLTGSFFSSLLIAMIVNTRTIGGAPIQVSS